MYFQLNGIGQYKISRVIRVADGGLGISLTFQFFILIVLADIMVNSMFLKVYPRSYTLARQKELRNDKW